MNSPTLQATLISNLASVGVNVASPTGWHDLERAPGRAGKRWSQGVSAMPAGARLIVVELAEQGQYWDEPESSVVSLFGTRPTIGRA